MKQEFLNFLNALIAAAPDVAEELMSESVKAYIEALSSTQNDKPEITDNGKLILNYMQKNDMPMWKARDIAEGLFVSSRGVSGSLRKLVQDGFCEKVGENPAIYALTEKGKNYKIDN